MEERVNQGEYLSFHNWRCRDFSGFVAGLENYDNFIEMIKSFKENEGVLTCTYSGHPAEPYVIGRFDDNGNRFAVGNPSSFYLNGYAGTALSFSDKNTKWAVKKEARLLDTFTLV